MSKHSPEKLNELLKENPFPVITKDPKTKESKDFGTKIAKHIYYKGMAQDASSSRRNIAIENREFAANMQSVEPYKGLLDAKIDGKGSKSYMNIDWSIAAPGKKFVDIIVGDMSNQDYKIQFNAIDSYSKSKMQEARDEYYGRIVKQRDIAELEAQSGLVLESKGDFNPSSKEEVDIYMDLDYKQAIEIGMEGIVDFELNNNKWDVKLKKRVIRDFVENNFGGVRLNFDRNNNISLRYVDAPLNYYSSYTDEPDFSDVEYEAERLFLSIRDLKNRDINGEITEDQWFKIAKKSANNHGNSAWRFGESYSSMGAYNGNGYSYDDYRVECLDFIFYTEDRITYADKSDKFGGRHISKKSFGYKKPERSKKDIDVIAKDIEMSYEGVWVVGADIILGYGRSKNILRPKTTSGSKISPKLIHRYIMFQPNMRNGTSKSFVDVMKPNLKMIQLLVLRKRHVIAEMTPVGVAIDVSGLSDVMAALKITDPLEIAKLYKQKGILYYSRTDVNGDPVNGTPIQALSNPFAEQLVAIDNAILNEIEHIRGNTGINDARDGSAPDKDALVGIEKMRLLASNNTTREMYKGFFDGVFANIGKVMARMVQYKVEYGDGLAEYENIIGEQGVKSVEFAKDVTMAELGVKIEAMPTDAEIETLLNMLNVSLQNQEIRPEDYLEVKRINNVKKAERLLIYRRKLYASEKMQEFQQKEQITAEREASSAMASAEAEKVKQQAMAEAEKDKFREEYRLKKELSTHETLEKMKLIDREAYWKDKMLEKQLEEGDDKASSSFGVDKPKIMSHPGEAIQRQASINP